VTVSETENEFQLLQSGFLLKSTVSPAFQHFRCLMRAYDASTR